MKSATATAEENIANGVELSQWQGSQGGSGSPFSLDCENHGGNIKDITFECGARVGKINIVCADGTDLGTAGLGLGEGDGTTVTASGPFDKLTAYHARYIGKVQLFTRAVQQKATCGSNTDGSLYTCEAPWGQRLCGLRGRAGHWLDQLECGFCTEPTCLHSKGPCEEGYVDKTNGNYNWWACGVNCAGGKYYTDGTCGCACIKPEPECTNCYDQGVCDAGYMDTTAGKYKWWACGVNCPGGRYYTDGTCECACQKRPTTCPVGTITPLWQKLGWQLHTTINTPVGHMVMKSAGLMVGFGFIALKLKKSVFKRQNEEYELLSTMTEETV